MIQFENVRAALSDSLDLKVEQLSMQNHESWAIIGGNGSGKSAFASLLTGTLKISEGHASGINSTSIASVSFEAQQALIDREQERDDSDITNQVWQGTPVAELLAEVSDDNTQINHWAHAFKIEHLLTKGFRKLSTGESRKVILIRALLQQDKFLVLDEPFDGLDANSQAFLQQTLQSQHDSGRGMLLILNRLDEVPDWITHLGFLHNLQLLAQGDKTKVLDHPTVQAYLTFNAQSLELPERDPCCPHLAEHISDLVNLVDGKVAYSDRLIFKDLNWRIQRGEHWAVLGPNGCGKSTLLNLISGDHPQCYANDLTVFGIKRGSGESIWDIKQHIGIISAALQWNYKASTNVLSTVVSGLFDSIGLYNQVEEHQKNLALQWLTQVQLAHKANEPLHQLSYGEQRLVLICRAMIKQPALLILDEPCQGLDEPNRQLVLGFIELLAQHKDTTLLYVTHHSGDLLPCFDKRLICTHVDESTGSHWQIEA
ncbi:MAG: molybdate ABC transporter ATP-binding protein ModF [Gammaproteobacteria bacterium]|nr:molybdate ABC transporter ATP-binding protein ModF [Gammaproteobacteria bacterium]